MGRSRLTREPTARAPRLERFRVSAITSAVNSPSPVSTTVRQTPLTAMESPCLRAFGDDGSAQSEAGGVAEVLDGGDLTQFFDDSGEHSVLLCEGGGGTGTAVMRRSGPMRTASVMSSRNACGDGGDSGVGEGGGARAEQYGGEIADDLVDGARGEEGPGEGGAAFEQDGADAALVQGGEQRGESRPRPSAARGSRTIASRRGGRCRRPRRPRSGWARRRRGRGRRA